MYLSIMWHMVETGFQECVVSHSCRIDHVMTTLSVDHSAVVKDYLFTEKHHKIHY